MDKKFNQNEDEDKQMNLDSEVSTPDPPNTVKVINIADEMEATFKNLED